MEALLKYWEKQYGILLDENIELKKRIKEIEEKKDD